MSSPVFWKSPPWRHLIAVPQVNCSARLVHWQQNSCRRRLSVCAEQTAGRCWLIADVHCLHVSPSVYSRSFILRCCIFLQAHFLPSFLPTFRSSVLWHCWSGVRMSPRPVKIDCWGWTADVAGRRQLRSASRRLLNFPRYNMSNYARRAFCFAGPYVWNSLPEHIRQSTSIAVFKRSLKTFLLQQISH